MTDAEPVVRAALYDSFADAFREHAATGFWNADYDRPACLELLGEVAGKTVLDAACGPGLYAAELVQRGARVIGFDNSPRMIALCREHAPAGEFRLHDLAAPLDWLADASCDLVLCALALEYVREQEPVFAEFRRVLRPGGALVLSRLHPTGEWLRNGGNYFEDRFVRETWSKGWEVEYWQTSLERTTEALFATGFLIERIREIRPAPETAPRDPDAYARLTTTPVGFLAIRALPNLARG